MVGVSINTKTIMTDIINIQMWASLRVVTGIMTPVVITIQCIQSVISCEVSYELVLNTSVLFDVLLYANS